MTVLLPGSVLFCPPMFLPVSHIHFIPATFYKLTHHLEICFGLQPRFYMAIVLTDLFRQLIGRFLNLRHLFRRNRFIIYGMNGSTVPVYLSHSPEKHTVCHIFVGPFRSGTCCGRNTDSLFGKHIGFGLCSIHR